MISIKGLPNELRVSTHKQVGVNWEQSAPTKTREGDPALVHLAVIMHYCDENVCHRLVRPYVQYHGDRSAKLACVMHL